MSKYTTTLAALCLLCSCNYGGGSPGVPKVDTVFAASISEDSASVSNTTPNHGTWKAVIKRSKNKPPKIQVTGIVPTGNPAAIVTLIKDASSSSSELVLVLSREPVTSNEKGNKVTYKETLSAGVQYKKITIIHGKKTVAVIGNIKHSN